MPITAKQIRSELPRWRMPKSAARHALREARDAMSALLKAKTDAERARIFNNFEKHFIGYGRLENLALWSALANPDERLLRLQERHREAMVRERAKRMEDIVRLARVLQQRTGISVMLALSITRRKYNRTAMHPSWPVRLVDTVQVVDGPKGSLPLSGHGSPWDILEERRMRRKRARKS